MTEGFAGGSYRHTQVGYAMIAGLGGGTALLGYLSVISREPIAVPIFLVLALALSLFATLTTAVDGGDTWSPENSQQFLDPYSLTHLLHGVLLYGLLAWIIPTLSLRWRFWLAVSFESLWEVLENTDRVIERYRGVTAAIGYQGDTILNSVGDIVSFGLGFALARQLGLRRSVALFAIIEIALLFWIKDSLILNVIMLTYPLDGIRAWQLSH